MKGWSVLIRPSRCFSTTNNYLNASAICVGLVGVLAGVAAFALIPLQAAILSIPLMAGLSMLAAIDIQTKRLPDALTLSLLLLGVLLSVLGYGPSPLASAFGAALGWGGLASIAYFYRMYRGIDGLGLGDAKLLGALGAWTGALALPAIVLTAALLGLAYYGMMRIVGAQLERQEEIPFGPFLSFAGCCAFIVTHMDVNSFQLIKNVM